MLGEKTQVVSAIRRVAGILLTLPVWAAAAVMIKASGFAYV